MNNRLEILAKKRGQRKWFCAFLTLGYPSLAATRRLAVDFEKEGADVLELGFPFSDPMADGPTIQHSSEHALAHGIHMEDAFKTVEELRRRGLQMPVIFFTYFNPVFHFGLERFLKRAKATGYDGVIIPDLPPDLEPAFHRSVRRHGLCEIFLVAPTSSPERSKKIASASSGFVYYVSLKGVTGARQELPGAIRKHVQTLRGKGKKPVLIGFGVSSPAQARALSGFSDGVIVGSAIIDAIRKSGGKIAPAVRLVRSMVRALQGAPRDGSNRS